MFILFLAVTRFLRIIAKGWTDPEFRAIVLAAVLTLTVGTIFYRFTEGWSTLNSLYFCVTTLTTIGFGDYAPKTALGKIFTIIYVLIGLGILGAFIHALFEASARDRRKD